MAKNEEEEMDIFAISKKYSTRQYIQIALLILSGGLGGMNLSKTDDTRESIIILQEQMKGYQKEVAELKGQLSFYQGSNNSAHEKLNDKIDKIAERYYR